MYLAIEKIQRRSLPLVFIVLLFIHFMMPCLQSQIPLASSKDAFLVFSVSFRFISRLRLSYFDYLHCFSASRTWGLCSSDPCSTALSVPIATSYYYIIKMNDSPADDLLSCLSRLFAYMYPKAPVDYPKTLKSQFALR